MDALLSALAAPAFTLRADGRTFTPGTMAATGDGSWAEGDVRIRLEFATAADGSHALTLEADGVAWVDEVCLLDLDLGADGPVVHNHRWYDHLGFQQSTVLLLRTEGGGAFACYTNPFARLATRDEGSHVRLSYRPAMAVRGQFRSDPLVFGSFSHEGVEVRRELLVGRDISDGREPMYGAAFGPAPTSLDRGEVRAVRSAVAARMPWRAGRTQVLHWDWAENLYRFDLAHEADRAVPVFERMARLASAMGVERQLLSLNIGGGVHLGLDHEDGMCQPLMWLGCGVEVGRGEDDDAEEPAALARVLDVVRDAGLDPVSYSNPQVVWGKERAWLSQQLEGASAGWGCMAIPEMRDAALAAYRRVGRRHRLGGFSLDFVYWMPCQADDHGHEPGEGSLYAQWDGYRRIVAELCDDPGNLVEGLIGSQHLLPWGIGPMTHPHPVLGDNQPQWLPAWPDLSLDRVAANFARRMAWTMRNMAMLPSWKVPGLVGRQASRRVYDPVERGWDWDGARFGLLSAIASAPSSIVIGFLPCWDASEWAAVGAREVGFFRRWIDFAKDNAEVLTRLEDLYEEPRPGAVDGTIALDDTGRGFAFLCNPDFRPLVAPPVAVPGMVDGTMLRELHPEEGRWWNPGAVTCEALEVMVFDVVPPADQPDGPRPVRRPTEPDGGVSPTLGPWIDGGGRPVGDHELGSLTGAVHLRTGWAPGRALPARLAQLTPPVAPRGDKVHQPWSDPSRLRLFVDIIDPQAATVRMRVDGREVPVQAAYVGGYEHVKDTSFAVMENNLMGWYVDLADRLAAMASPTGPWAGTDLDQPWSIELDLELRGHARFRGVHIASRPGRSTEMLRR